jgi:hypothetical protein
MELFITCDANWDARLDKILDGLSQGEESFRTKDYGTSMGAISIILMCRDPVYNFKQRIKFSKKEKRLSTDIMLDLEQFRVIELSVKEEIVAGKLLRELPVIIGKYKFEDFDLGRFENDLKILMKKLKWI